MKKYIYSSLKCIVYDKLLKPRQSFWITLYIKIQTFIAHILTYLNIYVFYLRFTDVQ